MAILYHRYYITEEGPRIHTFTYKCLDSLGENAITTSLVLLIELPSRSSRRITLDFLIEPPWHQHP